jgi:hypothetical protein
MLLIGNQGDQIWRIFAYWAILFFGQFYENYTRSSNLFHGRSYTLILTKSGLRHTFGDFFTNSSGHPVGNAAAFWDVCSCQSFGKTFLHNLHITYLCNIFGMATQQHSRMFVLARVSVKHYYIIYILPTYLCNIFCLATQQHSRLFVLAKDLR